MRIKVLAAEGNLSSASNVGTATVVRLFNNHSAALLITRKTSGGTTIGSITVNTKESVILEKDSTDTLTAASNGGSVLVTQVAYGN
tara:strand:- start:1620 stop:1877 length:258 start_codon:yes stop_codon:yes gene_type:complete